MKISIKYMIIGVLGTLMTCWVPANAQFATTQEWKTVTMQGSGSAYSAKITPVGATTAYSETTTTYNSPSRIHGRQMDDFNETGENGIGDNGSPVGDALLPLLLFALIYCTISSLRKKSSLTHHS